jgi:hypothetical protein
MVGSDITQLVVIEDNHLVTSLLNVEAIRLVAVVFPFEGVLHRLDLVNEVIKRFPRVEELVLQPTHACQQQHVQAFWRGVQQPHCSESSLRYISICGDSSISVSDRYRDILHLFRKEQTGEGALYPVIEYTPSSVRLSKERGMYK